MSNLATRERKRLAELESVIEAGMQTFLDVGNALMEIRESRLYRETHGTFAAYCEERWSFSDRRARQLMAAAEIGTSVPVSSERHARALAPLIAAEGLEAASEFLASQPANVTAAELEQAVRAELRPARPSREEIAAMDYEELAERLRQLDPDGKFPRVIAAFLKVEEAQRGMATCLVAAVREIVRESDERSISDEQNVTESLVDPQFAEMCESFSDHGLALAKYDAMVEFVEADGPNEIERVEMLSWELWENETYVPFTEKHLLRWCESERERAAA